MRKLLLVAIPAITIMLATACQPPAEEAPPARTAEQVQADVDALRATWQELANADNAAGVADLYTEDAVFIDQYGGTNSGKAAIATYFERGLPQVAGYDIKVVGTVHDGDLVASYGTWSAMMGEMPASGMWQTVGQYQADGTLKLRVHSSMVPAPAPAAAPAT